MPWFQPQMNMLMDTFDGLMDSVVAQFKNLETVYVAQIRLDSAAHRARGGGAVWGWPTVVFSALVLI